jgi:3'(2'), 5'-bisphosphate nucleotidase
VLDQIKIQDVVGIAKHAGKEIMKIYRQDFNIEYKADNSPLTLADQEANRVIEASLNQLTFNSTLSIDIPILSEEGEDVPYSIRKNWEYFWLIDPLDGTKEFIKKNDEFTVNIALIHKNIPVLGVVYAPALDVCYWSKRGEGAYKDGQKLPLKKKQESQNIYSIVASQSHLSHETKNFIDKIETCKEKQIILIGSSLKICLVAEGVVDIYPRLGPTMEWDTGAAHAIVLEANKKLRRYVGKQYSEHFYNKESLLNDWFVVL